MNFLQNAVLLRDREHRRYAATTCIYCIYINKT